jgi:hypothetical protein
MPLTDTAGLSGPVDLFAPKGPSHSKGTAKKYVKRRIKQTLYQKPRTVWVRPKKRGPKTKSEVRDTPGFKEWFQYRVAQMAQFRNKLGFPDWRAVGTIKGMAGHEVKLMWAAARRKALKDMAILEKAGLLPDDEIAREATEATLKVMRADKVDSKTRLAAAGQLLAYYKVKPVQKTETKLDVAEAFLAEIAAKEALDGTSGDS